jgi:hypothetical protein
MNNSFARLIDGMCATLRSEVLTRLDDEFARGQVFGVINLLNTFKVRADWSVGFLEQQVQAQCEAFDDIARRIEGEPLPSAPPLLKRTPPQAVSAATLEAMRDDGNRAIGAMLSWLAAERPQLPEALAADIERELRRCMRSEIDIEMKNAPRPLFAEMSSGSEG